MGLGNTNTLNKKSISFIEKTISFVFVFYFAWWVYTQFYPENEDLILAWGLSYWIIAFIGGVAGLFFARYWGGFKSIIGKTILTLSIGLLLQAVGQNITNYYFLNNLEVYPSWADVGFFGSIPFYIYGAWLLTKVTGIRSVLKTTKNKVIAFLIFFIVLFSSISINRSLNKI